MKYILNNYNRIKLILFILLMGSLPFYHIISSILIIVGTFLSLIKIFSFKNFLLTSFDRLSILFVCYFILEVIGLGYTEEENLRIGLFNLEKHLALVFIPFICYDFNITIKYRAILLNVFVVSCFIATIICIVGNIYISLTEFETFAHEWRFSHNRFSEPISMQAVYFAMYLSFSFLITLNYFKENYGQLSGIKKVFIFLLLLYFLIIVIFLAARTIAATLMVLVVVVMIRYALKQKSYKILATTALIPVIFIGFIFLQPIVKMRFMDMLQSNYENTNYGSYFSRTKIWGPGLAVIKENLWVGVGTGDDQTELDKKLIKYNYLFGVHLFNMHNQYLQVLLTYGIIGFLFFIFILYVLLKDSIIKRDLLYLSFLILFMSGCLTESMLCRNKGIIYFLLFSFIFYKSKKLISEKYFIDGNSDKA